MDEDDIKKMNEVHGSKKNKEICLWCYSGDEESGKSRSRSNSPKAKRRSSRYDGHVSKMSKVDEIFQKLDDTHKNKFTPEQKRAWAHMIELGKHDSYDEPPNNVSFS